MAASVRVGSGYRIVIPKALREAMGIHPGDQLIVEAADATGLRLRVRPRSFTAALAGIGRGLWDDIGPDRYLRRERDSWAAP